MHILVFRFSAMGDVALLTPLLQAFANQYPEIGITLVTRNKFAAFFYGIPSVSVYEADFENTYKGFKGLFRLYKDLKTRNKYDCIIDVHQNLRTTILKSFFSFSATKSFTIDKGRAEKKALTRRNDKIRKTLPHTVDRYLKTFEKAGYPLIINEPPYIQSDTNSQEINRLLEEKNILFSKQQKWIGIAPFAQHQPKMWEIENFTPLLEKLYAHYGMINVFLFGGGKNEIEELQKINSRFPKAVLVAGKLSLSSELNLIKKLDLMICMDSGNMHLAALSGVPVLSVWGATHPSAGFGPYRQSDKNTIQIDEKDLPCRPCSVFGNKPCFRRDLACLTWITPEMVFERVIDIL